MVQYGKNVASFRERTLIQFLSVFYKIKWGEKSVISNIG